jgi:beta-xylosidase
MANLTEFTNPIIPGFAPDPSVVLVDGIFFLVNSSFHVFPGLPIYASRDLKNWTQIGNVTKVTLMY